MREVNEPVGSDHRNLSEQVAMREVKFPRESDPNRQFQWRR